MSIATDVKFSTPAPISIDLGDQKAQTMINVLKSTSLPASSPLTVAKPWDLGLDLKFLQDAKKQFEESWSFTSLQDRINNWGNFLVTYEVEGVEAQLHYVHVKSPRNDAVPIILLHGWPGKSFIKCLRNESR